MELKSDAPSRSVTEVGVGDYVKIGTQWKRIGSNSATNQKHPRDWSIHTADGGLYGMFGINRYAKAEDLE